MRFLLPIICLSLALPAFARPVSYPDGWTVMQMNNPDRNRLHVHYSPTFKHSIGYVGEYQREEEYQLHALQLNQLVKRWNAPASQANFYVKTGVGVAQSDAGTFDSKTDFAAYTGIAMDWEDRRYFTSYENRAMSAGDIDSDFSQSARIGIAPYIGDYGDLHTWLMLQVDHMPGDDDQLTVTPLVRLFKGVNLVEAGMNDNGEVLFNWIIRF